MKGETHFERDVRKTLGDIAGQVGVLCAGGLGSAPEEVQIRLPDSFMHIMGRVKELNPGLDVGSDSCYDNTGDWVLIVRTRE